MSRYELLERIGVGGMAEVYRGVVTSLAGFEKPVAIKKILPHLGRDDRFVQMLISEAKILASLRQRNIVQIYDVGYGDDEQYFLVMEYVDGCDLGALYERMEQVGERMSVNAALHIGAEVCEALDHAHRLTLADGRVGLIHRDVSPSNILLSFSGEVKLTDFGIAKVQDEKSVVASLKGKFAYMSPEQARAQGLEPRSDLFCLGIVLYELLLGRRLYSHLADLDALRFVRETRVPRPTSIDDSFPPELEEILLTALAPDPRQRWQSAAEMGSALRNYRYTTISGGDPAAEIAQLVRKHSAPQPGGKGRQRPSVLKLTTVAGFPTGAEPVPAGIRPGNDDDPTRHMMSLAARERLRAPSEAPTLSEATVDDRFDVGTLDDGETGRRAETDPFSPDSARTGLRQRAAVAAASATADADAGAWPRRRVLVLTIVLMVVAAMLAFVITGSMSAGSDDETIKSPPTGESLPAPTMKAPVKREKKRK